MTTVTLSVDAATPPPEAIRRAAGVIRAGGLVAFPTETVYGLAADAANGEAVAALYEAKGRPRFNPLIAHVPGLPAAEAEAVFDEHVADDFVVEHLDRDHATVLVKIGPLERSGSAAAR